MKLKVILNALEGILQFVNNFSVRADGNTPITNPLTLISGTNVNLVQVGDTIQINANASVPPVLTGYIDQEEYLATNGQVNFPLVGIPLDATQVFVSVRGQFLDASEFTYNSGDNSVDITGGVILNSEVSFYISTGLNGVTFSMETFSFTGSQAFPLSGTPVDSAGVLAIIDGCFVPKADYIYDSSDNQVEILSSYEVADGQTVSIFFQSGVSVLRLAQEELIGAVNGSNRTFGPMRFDPNEIESVMLLRDGRRVPYAEYTLTGKTFIFNVGEEPQSGQIIEAIYLFVSASSEQTQYVTMTQAQVDAKQLQLSFTPKNPTEVLFDTKSNSFMIYGDDFEIEGNVVKWTGLGFESLAADGSQLSFHYHI